MQTKRWPWPDHLSSHSFKILCRPTCLCPISSKSEVPFKIYCVNGGHICGIIYIYIYTNKRTLFTDDLFLLTCFKHNGHPQVPPSLQISFICKYYKHILKVNMSGCSAISEYTTIERNIEPPWHSDITDENMKNSWSYIFKL